MLYLVYIYQGYYDDYPVTQDEVRRIASESKGVGLWLAFTSINHNHFESDMHEFLLFIIISKITKYDSKFISRYSFLTLNT